MNEAKDSRKARIEYPCRWFYTIIGSDEPGIRAAIAHIVPGRWEITASRSSATGKYRSLNLAVEVQDEPMRIAIYESLCKMPSVKRVL